jgi:hypothetical protein
MRTKLALAVAVALAGRAVVSASEADVAWIGKLPGVTLQSSKTTSSEGLKAIYTLSGDAASTMDSVRSGLVERGWTIDKAADVPAGSASVRSLSAEKQGARLKLSVTGAMGIGTLTLSLRGGSASAGPSAGSYGSSSGTGSSVSAATSGGLVVAGRAVTETHDCGGGDVSVNGSSSMITLKGECGTVTVAGNSNTVTIKAKVRAIHAMGRANTVVWSAEKNPQAPVVKHVGSQNRIHSDAQP